MSDSQLKDMEPCSVVEEGSKPKRNPTLITGVPYLHPAFAIQFNEFEHSLSSWDRVVLLLGGAGLGFSLGVCLTISLIATHGESVDVGLLACAGVVFLSSIANGFLIVHTQKLIHQMSTTLGTLFQQQPAS